VLEQVKASILAGQRGQRTSSMAAVAVGAYRTAATAPAAVAAEVPVADRPGHNGAPVLLEEPPPPYDERGRRWPWIALLLVLLLAGGAAAAYLLTRPVKVAVPTVINEPLVTASAQLQNANLNVSTVTVPNGNPSGTVIRQNPQGGTRLNEGSTVTLTVSSGPGNAQVPSVVGLPLAEAKAAITRANLKPGRVTYEPSDTVPKDQVISTDPSAGQTPAVGTAVTIIVSSGKPLVGVPDVTGQSEAAAKTQLQQAGFTVGSTSTQTSSSVPAGNVISQSPTAGTKAPAGTAVNLVIAKAPPPPPATASVPDVTGKPAADANAALTAAGFKVVQKTKEVKKQQRDGVVLSENPAANSTANKGSTVTIVVGHYTAPPNPPGTTTSTTTGATTPTTSNTTTA
jgi:serine/threonine-protein kinase